MDLYKNLFELTKQNMADAGVVLDCDAESFCASVGMMPVAVDLTAAEKLTGKAYANAVWLSLFQKRPTKEQLARADKSSNADILQMAVNEPLFSTRQMQLEPATHPVKISIKGKAYAGLSLIKNSVTLRKIAKKMPKGIQDKIRGMF